jgi:hypothetical protein
MFLGQKEVGGKIINKFQEIDNKLKLGEKIYHSV